ncbi:diguanylate cyclase (GGDEF)-like protein [Rhodobium orientis]|uniref:diguanylate cyclase n=2 Tax=Rhodobium orientis TaxID=34017 RepID=A0A327JR85_9HYPH|nr:diguanylate cyclase [Rhodobium orientis]MBB4302288.1 diguanylate cyclase (GGDEF)-like protein [Rhodobium orientis]MBK5948998.1 hypothetical protein [Rhodobium orientis]RAI28990.1 hypothetical protein CH339_04720 [Rhodobium orientis]
MSPSTRLLMVGQTDVDDQQPELESELSRRGFEIHHSDAKAASNLWAATRSDVVILDLLAATAAGEREVFSSLAERLSRSGLSDHRPVIALADPSAADTFKETVANVDDVLYAPLTAAELVSRIDGLRRLTTMQTELARRTATAASFGVDLPEILPPGEIADANVLVVGEATHFLALETALSAHAVLVGAFTTDTAFDYLSRREFDAVIVALGADDAFDFVQDVRRNPLHFNLPLVVIGERGNEAETTTLFDAGASEVAAIAGAPGELAARLTAHIREFRFRQRLNAVYRHSRRHVICDGLTGLYTRGFLLTHLTRIIDDAERWEEPFTVAAFGVPAMDAINIEYGYPAGDLALRQLGNVIGQVVRGEDLAARFDGPRFAVVFTDTNMDAAETAARRIAAIAGNTAFSLDGGEAFSVDLWTGLAQFKPGDTPQSLIDRALAQTGC